MNTRAQDQIVGGVNRVDLDKAGEILTKLKANLHRLKDDNLKLIHVNEVTQQVVAGALYVIRGIFEDNNGDPFNCEISVWERSWLEEPDKLIVEVKAKEAFVGEIPANRFVGDDTTSSSNSEIGNKMVLLLCAVVLLMLPLIV